MTTFLETPIASLVHIGAHKAMLLARELGIETYGDLLTHFPVRYEDRSRWYRISEIQKGMEYVQCKGQLGAFKLLKKGKRSFLTAPFTDGSGTLWLTWLNGIYGIRKKIFPNQRYVLYGKPIRYKAQWQVIHPSLSPFLANTETALSLQPIYHTTTKMKKNGLKSRDFAELQQNFIRCCKGQIQENLPTTLLARHTLMAREAALLHIHFPKNTTLLKEAVRRLKFEEVFYLQLQLRQKAQPLGKREGGLIFANPRLVKAFYNKLPFPLTDAQKRVIKEIYRDLLSGQPMNRLLQGDVGSGKTIVAFISMLFPLADKAQVALMAPTEILATQHYQSLLPYAKLLNIRLALLIGSTSKKVRKQLHEELLNGELHLLIGTHTLLEEEVQFQALGLVIIDEQHRFGVAQRAKLWNKQALQPHMLVMTATPIPRTLAMTLYSHLTMSVIDEMPPDRKPVKTFRACDRHRLRMLGFIREQVTQGKQAYIVYPRIEESSNTAYKDLMDGYEGICRAFPQVGISIVHGRMKSLNKQYEMNRFVEGTAKIMVATTVIEVGVNVPNATVMVVENAESFGLAQLHQLRGRIGRSAAQSFCILMTKDRLSDAGEKRIRTMLETSDGFKIADVDLRLRGPGHLTGLAQSGTPPWKLIDFSKDHAMIRQASEAVKKLLAADPSLTEAPHRCVIDYLTWLQATKTNWMQIS